MVKIYPIKILALKSIIDSKELKSRREIHGDNWQGYIRKVGNSWEYMMFDL